MRILLAIPHFYDPHSPSTAPTDSTKAGSAEARARALSMVINKAHELFSQPYLLAEHQHQRCIVAPREDQDTLDIFVVASGDKHLLDHLSCSPHLYRRANYDGEAPWLGLGAHKVIAHMLGQYDWYGYLEDDTLIEDPLFFLKLRHASALLDREVGPDAMLQPSRYETVVDAASHGLPAPHKLYLDWECGDASYFTAPSVQVDMLGRRWTLEPARHPHAGCFFLDQRRAEVFVRSKYCGAVPEQWVLPGDTVATLGIVRNFRVYKAARDSLPFLEVRHLRPAMLNKLRMVEEGVYTWRKRWPVTPVS